MSFAEKTDVPVERSKAEIERLLTRYGASKFMSAWSASEEPKAAIGFEMHGRSIRIMLPLPHANALKFHKNLRTRYGQSAVSAVAKRHEQECRRLWRALALVIKAKLEAVASGVVTFEDEWLPHFVLPGGRTVGDMVRPEIQRAYESGQAVRLLPDFSQEAR